MDSDNTDQNEPTSLERRPNRAMVKDITIDEKWRKALELRKMHLTYAEIGERLGCAPDTAATWVRKALKFSMGKEVEDYRNLELVRLDELARSLYPMALAGDLDYVKAYLDVSKARRMLLGLDMTKQEVTHKGNAPGSQQAIIVVGGDGTKSFIASVEEYARMSQPPQQLPPIQSDQYEEAMQEYADEIIDADIVITPRSEKNGEPDDREVPEHDETGGL